MGVVVTLDSEVAVLMVDTLLVSCISLRVSLVYLFCSCSRLLIEISLVLMITLVRVVVNLLRDHLLFILVMVVTLGQPDLLVMDQLMGHVIAIGVMVIIRECALVVGRLLLQLKVFSLSNQFIPYLDLVCTVIGVVPRVLKVVLRNVGEVID